MLDNFSLIPDEACTAMGDVANNLINKIADVTGYIFTPRGKRKDREEAVNYFIDEIKKNDKMPVGLKAASISEARRLLKKYINQQDILSEAMKFLSDTADPKKMDDDWLMAFMDKAANASSKDIQIIYSKILAEEVNNPGKASKALVNTISIMDRLSAEKFGELLKCAIYVKTKQGEEPIVIYPMFDQEKYSDSLRFADILNLSSLGLLDYKDAPNMEYTLVINSLNARYGDLHFTLKCKESKNIIEIGDVGLTRMGRELGSILTPDIDQNYFEKIKQYWKNHDIDVIEI